MLLSERFLDEFLHFENRDKVTCHFSKQSISLVLLGQVDYALILDLQQSFLLIELQYLGLLLHILQPSVELWLSLIFSLAVRANRHKIHVMYYGSLLGVLCQILRLLGQNWVSYLFVIKHKVANRVIFCLICGLLSVDLWWLCFLILCSYFVWWTVWRCVKRACRIEFRYCCTLESISQSGMIHL